MRLKKFFAALFILFVSATLLYASDIYDSEPSFSPYYAGSVRSDLLYDALEELNYIRRLIGVHDNVELDSEMTRKAQHGAVLLDALDTLTHTPGRPSDMDSSFYELGYDATSHGNIAVAQMYSLSGVHGNITLSKSTKLYMDDSDSYNLSALGHRRWLMNPRMKRTGFGISTRRGYEVTYVIDEFKHSGEGNVLNEEEYARYLDWLKWPISDDYIAWPTPKSPHPLTYFDSQTAWSVTLNGEIYADCNISSVNVKLTRQKDGRTWNFGASGDDGFFNIAPNNVAYDECIIFRPDGVESYSDGEIWQAEITGLTLSDGTEGTISYTVRFTGALTGYEEGEDVTDNTHDNTQDDIVQDDPNDNPAQDNTGQNDNNQNNTDQDDSNNNYTEDYTQDNTGQNDSNQNNTGQDNTNQNNTGENPIYTNRDDNSSGGGGCESFSGLLALSALFVFMGLRRKRHSVLLAVMVLCVISPSVFADDDIYVVRPEFSPYRAGIVKREVLNEALAEVNYARWLAGVPADVTLNEEYTRRAQIGAVLLDANDTLTHEPEKPHDMPQDFYEAGFDATTHGNIAYSKLRQGKKTWGNLNLIDTTKLYMEDTDGHNVGALGHRRWLLNPRLKQVGFGISTRLGYSVTYVIEDFPVKKKTLTKAEYAKYLDWLKWPIPDEFVAWPSSKHPHPLSWFEAKTAWSVTLNRNVFSKCDSESVSVRMTRLDDGRVWNFGHAGNDGYFEAAPDNVAYDECLIFCPDNVERYMPGEMWRVEVFGLTRKDGRPGNLSYIVSFTE